jgi:hypothetical protein
MLTFFLFHDVQQYSSSMQGYTFVNVHEIVVIRRFTPMKVTDHPWAVETTFREVCYGIIRSIDRSLIQRSFICPHHGSFMHAKILIADGIRCGPANTARGMRDSPDQPYAQRT